ncbi:hypothetical protein [Flavobacterium aquicola]|uniref:Uncharacterized protein n=1 Tax=Flavobacterium aquicola TaxID=1682742 RepID=A0A3E0EUD0_9FLAO|nr:hypothetical protein [Flavobacterium aquicola]REH00767.1 hypothetical protein C8P67_10211 [Flavobacterium aquicola]
MDDNLDDWDKKRKGYLAVAIICFIIGAYLFIRVHSDSYVIKSSNLKTIGNLIASDKPKFEEITGKHARKWIEFKCAENKSTFKIANFDYRCVNDDEVLNEINVGDTISIQILKDDIENFDTETTCEIHSLVKNKKEYLDIECRNKKENKDSENVYIILFSVTIMTGGVYCLIKKPKFFDEVDPCVPIWIIIIVLFFVLH